MLLVIPGLNQGAPSSPRAYLPTCHPLFSLPRTPRLGMSSPHCPAPGSSAASPSLPARPLWQLAVCGQPPRESSLKPLRDAPLCRGANIPRCCLRSKGRTLQPVLLGPPSGSVWPSAIRISLPAGPARCPPSRRGLCYFSTFLERLRN